MFTVDLHNLHSNHNNVHSRESYQIESYDKQNQQAKTEATLFQIIEFWVNVSEPHMSVLSTDELEFNETKLSMHLNTKGRGTEDTHDMYSDVVT